MSASKDLIDPNKTVPLGEENNFQYSLALYFYLALGLQQHDCLMKE